MPKILGENHQLKGFLFQINILFLMSHYNKTLLKLTNTKKKKENLANTKRIPNLKLKLINENLNLNNH
jgi:hypothetical protein